MLGVGGSIYLIAALVKWYSRKGNIRIPYILLTVKRQSQLFILMALV